LATVKAYLDNNVVSALVKNDQPTESEALDRLLAVFDAGNVELVTSDITLGEIKKYAGPGRPPAERTYRLLKKVPVVPWDRLVGINSYGDGYTWINTPMIQTETLYASLRALGIKEVDAQHVFVAANQHCDVFLTCDGGVLARAAGIQQLCGLFVQKPSDLVTAEGW
jgi:hypothetical protein